VFILPPPFSDVGEVWILPNDPAPHLVGGLLGNPLSRGERNQRASCGHMKEKCKLMNSQRSADHTELRERGIGFPPNRPHRAKYVRKFAN
jgi:hypothetical protein